MLAAMFPAQRALSQGASGGGLAARGSCRKALGRERQQRIELLAMAARSKETIVKTHFGRTAPHHDFELKFDSLLSAGRGFVFPCDADGRVSIGEFSDVLRTNYFYACAGVGSELAWPVVAKSRPSASALPLESALGVLA